MTLGKRVTFSCDVVSQPVARIAWRKNGFDFVPPRGVTSYSNGTIVFQSVKETDAGYYQCSAYNALGQALSKYANLNVRCKSYGLSEWLLL